MGAHKGEVQLRLTRAIAAGLASSGSMGAAALCVLVIGSATIAFDDWPGGLRDDRRGVATIAPLPDSVPSAPAERAAPALPRRFPAPPRLVALSPRPERLSEGTRDRRLSTARAGGRGLAPASAAPPSQASPPAAPTPAPRPLHDTAVAAAGAVRTTGRTVGAEISKVHEPTGRQVVAATDATATTLEQVADLLP